MRRLGALAATCVFGCEVAVSPTGERAEDALEHVSVNGLLRTVWSFDGVWALSSAGDVNGDGFDDVVTGDGGWIPPDEPLDTDGRIAVFYGSAAGLPHEASWTRRGHPLVDGQFGSSVDTAGDVNGDGFDDVIAGAPGHNGGRGAAAVYHGSAQGVSETEDWSALGVSSPEEFGAKVRSAGDVNGDGFDDVLVGSPSFRRPQFEEGRVALFLGSSSGLSRAPVWRLQGDESDVNVGQMIGSAGDVNGDGFDDVFVAKSLPIVDGVKQGQVLVFHGSSTGPGLTEDWSVVEQPTAEFWLFGAAVSSAGDVNGDGFDDLAVGLRIAGNPGVEGRVNVYLGSATGLGTTPAWTAVGLPEDGFAAFGDEVKSAGDVDADGYDDLMVGDPYWVETPGDDPFDFGVGRVLLFRGSPTGLEGTPVWSAVGAGRFDITRLGRLLGVTPGDVNGDGCADLLAATGQTTDPGAFLFSGSCGP